MKKCKNNSSNQNKNIHQVKNCSLGKVTRGKVKFRCKHRRSTVYDLYCSRNWKSTLHASTYSNKQSLTSYNLMFKFNVPFSFSKYGLIFAARTFCFK